MIDEISFVENYKFIETGNDHLAFAIAHIFAVIFFISVVYITFLILVWLCTDYEHD